MLFVRPSCMSGCVWGDSGARSGPSCQDAASPFVQAVGVAGRGWVSLVETPELAALVPELMARYPYFAWSITRPDTKEQG